MQDIRPKKRSGRPRKAEADKVQYQRIAVYMEDYKAFSEELESRGEQLTDAFHRMVQWYVSEG